MSTSTISQTEIYQNILFEREKRFALLNELQVKHPSIISITLNIPGYPKINTEYKKILRLAINLLDTILALSNITYEKIWFEGQSGKICYLAIKQPLKEHKQFELKKHLIYLENLLPFSRLIDFDLYVKSHKFSRQDFNIPERSCYICNNHYNFCIKAQNHSIEQLRFHCDKLIRTATDYIKLLDFIKLAEESILTEVSLHPKPALVTPYSNGAHLDMNFNLFLHSSKIISNYLPSFVLLPLIYPIALHLELIRIRQIGKLCEKNMFQTTQGINTQKGLIYLYGIILYALGFCSIKCKNININKLQDTIKTIAKAGLNDFKDNNYESHGMWANKHYNIKGIRGFAATGMDLAFKALDKLNEAKFKKLDFDNALKIILLYIISENDDSNIIWRTKSIESLHIVKKMATLAYNKTLKAPQKTNEIIYAFQDHLIRNKISPGGSADILAITIFLYLLKNKGYIS